MANKFENNFNTASFIHAGNFIRAEKSASKFVLTAILLLFYVHLASGKCYYMDKDLTIPGAEFRRELGLDHKTCAKACLNDICCMAYEWNAEGVCMFKSRSLNGTVGEKPGVHFGLCFVQGDPYKERDHFYDHELGGKIYASSQQISLEQCPQFCYEHKRAENKKSEDEAGNGHVRINRLGYTWHTSEDTDSFDGMGTCRCVEVLHYIKLNFGSASGYL